MDKPTQDRFNHLDEDLRDLGANLKETDKRLFELVGTVREIKGNVEKKGSEAHWVVKLVIAPLIVLLFAALVGLAYRSFDQRLVAVENGLKLVPAQIAAVQFSAMPAQDLKNHRPELTAIKNDLANASRNVAGFWPTSFQVINLLSKATAPVEAQHASMDLTNVSGIGGQGVAYPPGSVFKLRGTISDSIFTDAIVYFDSSVVLHNVTFINCTPVLPPVQATPSVTWQNLAKQLLEAKDFSRLTLTP